MKRWLVSIDFIKFWALHRGDLYNLIKRFAVHIRSKFLKIQLMQMCVILVLYVI